MFFMAQRRRRDARSQAASPYLAFPPTHAIIAIGNFSIRYPIRYKEAAMLELGIPTILIHILNILCYISIGAGIVFGILYLVRRNRIQAGSGR